MGRIWMKNLQLLTWVTQLGLSTAVPLVGFVWLALWLKERFALGNWVLFVGIGFGVYCAIDGFVRSLKVLGRMSKEKSAKEPPVSFNEHQ